MGGHVSDREKKPNPQAFIGTGICFLGSGIAITFALRDSILGAGMGLVVMGIVFLIVGAKQQRKLESDTARDQEDDRPLT